MAAPTARRFCIAERIVWSVGHSGAAASSSRVCGQLANFAQRAWRYCICSGRRGSPGVHTACSGEQFASSRGIES
eukprot:13992011-Alexandrium_andersonii.AAC.1